MTENAQRNNRGSLLKVRVRDETKRRVIDAAKALDLDQSTLIRLALTEYLSRHNLHAA